MGFSQSPQTLTLTFISSGKDSHKNYEAVIDDVSYFSENNAKADSQQKAGVRQNTIWLDNFLPGKHSIKVYGIRNGSNEERTGHSPVYSSTFTVKEGLDTKIAVKNNGHVQVTEKLSNSVKRATGGNKINEDGNATNKNINSVDNKRSGIKSSPADNDDFEENYKQKQFTPASIDEDDSSISSTGNFDGYERRSSKRLDTAIVYNNEKDQNALNAGKNSKDKLKSEIRIGKPGSGSGNERKDDNTKQPMNDDQFNELYESVRNQWRPGQKMKTLNNEFLNAEDNFSTAQAKKLIKLLTEEGNRLKLAKAVYPCITDPENFSELDTLLRYKASRDELDNFVSKGGKE